MIYDELLEPAKYYKERLKTQFTENADAFFEKLVSESGVDVDANKRVSEKYRKTQKEADTLNKRIGARKGWRIFLIILSVIAVIAGILMIKYGVESDITALIITGVAAIVAGVAGIILTLVFMNKAIKKLTKERDVIQSRANAFLKEAKDLISPLISLFDSDMTRKLIIKAVPMLKIDRNFDMRRYDYMSARYGFIENEDETESTLNLLSGEILGNPFVFERRLKMRMGTKQYTGTRVITYTVRTVDSNGKSTTRTVTQTLVAHVVKPMPYYSATTYMIYGNEAAPNLSFSRTPNHAERMSESELSRFVKKKLKKVRKQEEKNALGGGAFTAMGDEKFEALFGATDRDNEIEFRLLFTALAQKNMITLLRDSENYGDDFYFKKRKCLNILRAEHSENWDMSTSPDKYASYDVELCKQLFIKFNADYFRSLYFDFAPVLSIPLYQQQRPKEFIYGESYPRNITCYESEVLANAIGARLFSHPATNSGIILKTELMTKVGKSDKLSVKAFSYRTERRCDTVMVLGGDGLMHGVPVFWDEYIPVERLSVMDMKELGYTDREAQTSEAIKKVASNSTGWSYLHGIFACIYNGKAELDKEFGE